MSSGGGQVHCSHSDDLSEITLPFEVWRTTFAYLPVASLCCCSQVCKAWRHLVSSLDNTVWREHFLASHEWRPPYWPRGEETDGWKRPWQSLYREHYLGARQWSHTPDRSVDQAGCSLIFKRRKERKILHVGRGKEFETLKSALGSANEYDRILISPGVYDEQFEMSSKIPFELMGDGALGSVVLIMCIEQNASTGRLCNLALRAPWFTNHVVKVQSGHLQVDNCTLSDGQVIIQSPATAHFTYCSFSRLQMTLSHVSLSIIEHCEFDHCDNTTAICIDGYPKEEQNWAHQHMSELCMLQNLIHNGAPSIEPDSQSVCSSLMSKSHIGSAMAGSQTELDPTNFNAEEDSIGVASIAGSQASLPHSVCSNSRSNVSFETSSESSFSDGSLPGSRHSSPTQDANQSELHNLVMGSRPIVPSPYKCDLDNLSSSSSSEDTTMLELSGSCRQISGLRDDDAETYMEANLQMSFPETVVNDSELRQRLGSVQGVVIRHCKLVHLHGGIILLRQAQAQIYHNEFAHLQYALRCVQNSKVALVQNVIRHCSSSGVFMRLAAHGVIAGNDIYCTSEAGIDVRKNADPLIQCNKIHHSKRSGIVVLGSGCGIIRANDIYQNREAGIYILYRGNPYVCGNRIVHGGAAGIAVNEEGRGYISDNLISRNKWGGIDIRRMSEPRITRNLICNGLADGIVVGQNGRGTIEGNTIKGNVGCGVWVMCGQPLIQLNQIYNNNHNGVAFVQNRQGGEEDYSADDADDSPSEQSLDLDQFDDTSSMGDSMGVAQQPALKYNTIYHNNGYGILAQSTESLHMSGNAIHANRDIGIFVKQVSAVNILSNSITCNNGNGLQIAAYAKVTAEGNGIYDNNGHGVQAFGDVYIHANDIVCNQMCAIVLDGDAKVKISENRLHAPQDFALHIHKPGVQGSVTNNTLYSAARELIQEAPSGECLVKDNTVIEDEDKGEKLNSKEWHLENPPPRPHIDAPPTLLPKKPIRRVTTVTRVVVPSGGTCQHGSKTCSIL